jgi:hypothetical protein
MSGYLEATRLAEVYRKDGHKRMLEFGGCIHPQGEVGYLEFREMVVVRKLVVVRLKAQSGRHEG